MSSGNVSSNQQDTLHYYRITIAGYGGETAYIKVSKKAYEFWNPVIEEGDGDAVEYCLSAENGDFEFEDITEVPLEAQFLLNDEEGYSTAWYDAPGEFAHIWGAAVDHAWVTVEKIDSSEFDATHIEDVIDGEDLTDIYQRVGDETNWETELFEEPEEGTVIYPQSGDYVFQFISAEKGTFFESTIETKSLFDPNKLRFVVGEAPSGEDTLFSVKYDGEDLENNGGDTSGKGYSAYIWEQ